ncbi:hypothetical protein ABH935_009968 [Catenulispora sp. GAS73]|uniref:hypothetical protein n=1 Tax=Catenulispora sp. GAS73 TaxID=3156269 RepID=UPI00351263BC
MTHLLQLYGGVVPTIVSDSAVSASWASALGLPYRRVDELTETSDAVPSAALVILTRDENYARQAFLGDSFAKSRSLWLPLAAFDGCDEAVSYALGHLARMDFAGMLQGHLAALEFVEESSKMSFEGDHGTRFEVGFGPEVEFTMLQDLEVPVGEPVSLASFFEFATEIYTETFTSGLPLPFVVDGVLSPSGILCAYAPGAYHADDTVVLDARRLARRAASARTRVRISNGVIDAVEMDGEEVTQEFSKFAGPHGLRATEFAIGFHQAPEDSLDWRINSPVNEGVQGIHVGIGDGQTSLHFDFVCDDVAAVTTGY